MLHGVFSSLPEFKELHFSDGLNILLADAESEESPTATRNGAGKSSFVEVVHFVLGADAGKDSIFRHPALADASFGLDVDVEQRLAALRRGHDRGWVETAANRDLVMDNLGQRISVSEWKSRLGSAWFGLEPDDDQRMPSFRSLFPYFARRVSSGGFATPEKYYAQQQTGMVQLALSYLLGLGTELPTRWEALRQEEKSRSQVRQALSKGQLGDMVGSSAALRTRLAVVTDRESRLRDSLSSFTVNPDYRSLEQELSQVSTSIAGLSDDNTMDQRYADELREALAAEEPVEDLTGLSEFYERVGVELPDMVVRRYRDVAEFHASVVRNRQAYLMTELNSALERISARNAERNGLAERRNELLRILRATGALDTYLELQGELARVSGERQGLERQYELVRSVEETQVRMAAERQKLREQLRIELEERREILDRLAVEFANVSFRLYGDRRGDFIVEDTDNGPRFEASISADKSRGIQNMQVFTFDMVLMAETARQNRSPGFLIHDSHIFDGVDTRQVLEALHAGRDLADEHGFQYIVTMNSDALPKGTADFDPQEFVLPVTLSDRGESGGLFGVRFD